MSIDPKNIPAIIERKMLETLQNYFKVKVIQSVNHIGVEIRMGTHIEGLSPELYKDYVQFQTMCYVEPHKIDEDYLDAIAGGLTNEMMRKIFKRN